MKRYTGTIIAIALLLITFSIIAMAQEPGEEAPWSDVVVTFGGITIAWASAQMGLLQILKGVKIGDKPLLNSAGLIWLANAILGVIGMVIAATQTGTPWTGALVQAIIAVFAASGEYEFFHKTDKLGNSLQPSSQRPA